MELEFVTFEQAKALKELGFPQETEDKINSKHNYYYNIETNDNEPFAPFIIDTKECNYIRAPKLELAAKWLREVKDFNMHVRYYSNSDGYVAFWIIGDDYGSIHRKGDICFPYFDIYEQALSAGIDKAIEYLKNNAI